MGQPSANEIVFHGGFLGQIYSTRADGSKQVNLTNDPAAQHISPSWSPDGTRIVLIKNGRVWVMNADGTNLRELFLGGVEGYSDPVWSPDGTKIAVIFDGHGFAFPSINLIDANGQNFREIANSGSFNIMFFGIDWSPDGNRITFSKAGRIYVMNADGTGQTAITPDYYLAANPRWSPDGSKIVFWDCGACLFYFAVIGVINADGTNHGIINYSDWDESYPAWSPDGAKLVFASNRNGVYNIYIMNADGSNVVQVTQNAFDSFAPNWKRAAPAALPQLSGRVTTSSQRGVARARVTLDDGAGNVRLAITNPFGFFRFIDVPTGLYTVSVRSKSYRFTSRTVSITSSFTNLDFVALENPE